MNLVEALRSSEATSVQKFSIYLPNRDKHNREIESIDIWIGAAVELLTEINGGSTKLPPANGAFKTEAGEIIREDTVVVYSFLRNPDAFERNLERVAAFLHRFGQVTEQESVMVEMTDGHRAYFVNEGNYISSPTA